MSDARDKLNPALRMIVRYVALGLTVDDICVEFPEYTPAQLTKVMAGKTFQKAVKEMQAEIDMEMAGKAGEDPVRAYLRSKALSSAKVMVALADNEDGETPHSVRAKAADSILSKAGYNSPQDVIALPVIMLSQEKLNSVLADKPDLLKDVPDCVDGHQES